MDIILIVVHYGSYLAAIYIFVWGFVNLATYNEAQTAEVVDYEDTDWWEDVA